MDVMGSMKEDFHIRSMTPGDLEAVAAIEQACHSHPWGKARFAAELANPVASVDLCFDGQALAGFLCSWFVAGELEIHNVATSPRFRRRGVASLLLRRLFDRVEGQGLERAFLEVRQANAGAIRLYEEFGFAECGRRSSYYSDGEDAILMEWRSAEDAS